MQPPRHLETRLRRLQERLLGWYATHKRTLPWRLTRDPYKILVSEIMLQQTQVTRVAPKYSEFLARFPTLSDLAGAARADVIRAWAPLGYNRRAVRLHEIARTVVDQCDGLLPREPKELAQLQGLGPYTAAAVACFAFDRQVATLDTNARRVIGRLLADYFEYRDPSAPALLAAANQLLPAGRAADWNQALMDLGASICTARAPACSRCPAARECAGRASLSAGTGRPARRAAERASAYKARGAFVSSSRYYRGRIVQRLRHQRPRDTLDLAELGSWLREDFTPGHQAWLLALLRGLEADGLVRIEGDVGDPERVAVRLA
jgi:A/G-specific adenine glycosylase